MGKEPVPGKMGAHSGELLDSYIQLEDGDASPLKSASAERHDAAMAGIEKRVQWLNLQLNLLALTFFLIGGLLLWAWYYDQLPPEKQHEVYHTALLVSIPVVALFFTWFHIWLAIKMMFLPLRFFGIWQYSDTGIGIGWQGVIPRKAKKMGKIAFNCARPYLMGPKDWFARVDTSLLFAKIHPMLERVARASMASVMRRHFPSMLAKDGRLPAGVEDELVSIVMEKVEESFPEMWHKVTDKLCDPVIGLDNDGMIVSVFNEHKELLNHFFLSMGDKEFRFIERCGAALGFVCGLIQLLAFNCLDATGRMILLPGTGFFLGIFTNWLAIQMCFKPCHPRPVRVFGWYLGSIQGLFLKRQRDVATLYAKLLVDHFFDFHKVIAYLQTIPVWADLQDIYNENIQNMMKQTMGKLVTWIAPVAVGSHKLRAVEDDLVGASAERIAENDELQQAASQYLAIATDVFRSNAVAMQKMPPDEFERLLHPVFQEDEWILILLGGVLGAIVGIAQVYFLSE